MIQKPLDKDISDLRLRAEEKLSAMGDQPTGEMDATRLLHELKVQLIELELQNEALQDALAHAEAGKHFSDLYEFAPVAYLSVKRDGTIQQLNFAAASLIGLDRAKLKGQRLSDYVGAESSSAFNTFLVHIFACTGISSCEMALRPPGGGSAIEVQIKAVADPSGLFCYLAVTDISAWKRMADEVKNALHFQQQLMDAVPCPIFHKDAQGIYTGGNKAFDQYIGLSPAQYIGKTVFDIAPGDLAAKYDQADRTLLQNPGVQTYEASVVYADGVRHDVIFNKATFAHSDGQVAGLIGVLMDISERKVAESSLREREANFRNYFENNSSVMLLLDPESGRIAAANTMAFDFFGFPPDQLIGMSMGDINNMSDDALADAEERAINDKSNSFLFRHRLASGETRDVEVHLTPIDRNGRTFLFAIMHDVTERTQAETKLRLAATVFSHAREGIMITSADGAIIDVNDAFSHITGYSREEALGRNPRFLNSGRQPKAFFAAMWGKLNADGKWYGEIWNRRKNGEAFAEMLAISAVHDRNGRIQNYVALFSDITQIKEHERELEKIAHYDALTDLPNRVLLADRLEHAMAQTLRRGQRLAVEYLDLDGFKFVNDSYGHDVGDQLLMTVASRMKHVLREGDTLARLGGDEFVAVLVDLDEGPSGIATLSRLLSAAAEPLYLGDLVLRVSASIGVTYYPQPDDVEADLLLRQADQAMYRAKLGGKNRYAIFGADS